MFFTYHEKEMHVAYPRKVYEVVLGSSYHSLIHCVWITITVFWLSCFICLTSFNKVIFKESQCINIFLKIKKNPKDYSDSSYAF